MPVLRDLDAYLYPNRSIGMASVEPLQSHWQDSFVGKTISRACIPFEVTFHRKGCVAK
jgi:hypothetical protein